MNRFIKLGVVFVCLSVLLNACAGLEHLSHKDTKNDLNSIPVYVDGGLADRFVGKSLDDVFGGFAKESAYGKKKRGNQTDFRALFDEFNNAEVKLGTEAGNQELRTQLAALRKSDVTDRAIAPPLKGIAGLSTSVLLRILASEGDERFVTTGKIRDYVFLDETKEGHLSVDITIESYRRGVVYEREFLHWDLVVKPNGFEVHKREGDPNDPEERKNPFPEIPGSAGAFPEESLDPKHERSIWARGLDHKLFAKGEDAIKVVNVYRQINEGAIVRLSDDHPFYHTTEASCIDLLTRGYPPKNATELFAADNDYCLGRCDHPAVINTGGD